MWTFGSSKQDLEKILKDILIIFVSYVKIYIGGCTINKVLPFPDLGMCIALTVMYDLVYVHKGFWQRY